VGSSTKTVEGRRSIFRIKRDTTAADPRCGIAVFAVSGNGSAEGVQDWAH